MDYPTQNYPQYASVILDAAIDKLLDYGIPHEYAGKIAQGIRVEVPVRGSIQSGYVYEIKKSSPFPNVKPIAKVISEQQLITPELFNLALWMSKYYCSSLQKVLKMMLPASVRRNMQAKEQLFIMRGKTKEELKTLCESLRSRYPAQSAILDVMLQVKKGILLTQLLEQADTSRSPVDALVKKGFLILDIVRIDRSPLVGEEYFQTKPKLLNQAQAEALQKIVKSIECALFETHLLFGITGSGKTEIYLQAIDKALQLCKGTLMLVPEISLTPQTIERFRSRFEGKIAILHHRLSQGERFDEWQKIHRGEAPIVIGARSAIFSPIRNVGLIIIDEEHESSYKQTDEAPCYNARDVAVMRGKMAHAAVILGSATPSLESFYNAKQGKYVLSPLPLRAEAAASLPTFTIVDMKREFDKAKGYTNFSEVLLEGIKKRAVVGEQTILFLNRRGYHTLLLCRSCQYSLKCAHCDVSLTFHLGENALTCHLCGFSLTPPPRICPSCNQNETMKYRGVGTEQVEKSLYAVLPEIRIIRIDADTTKHKGSHQKLLRDFATGKGDVLLGTQMIAKGLHFPQVTLVGVLNCDPGLNIPDFRSSETTFQLITQVAGRAGRGSIPGEVIVQTSIPENTTVKLAAQQNYPAFYEDELSSRQLFHYPPCTQMVKISFSGEHEKETVAIAEAFRKELQQLLPSQFLLNPLVPSGHAKVKNKYRFQFFVRGPSIYKINEAITQTKGMMKIPAKVRLLVDVHPLSTFF